MPFDGSHFSQTSTNWLMMKLRQSFSLRGLFAPSFTPPPAIEVQILKLARQTIKHKRDWIQGTEKREDEYRTRRCAVGAVRYARHTLKATNEEHKRALAILHSVAHRHGFGSIEKMNDQYPSSDKRSAHKQVISAFDEAIAKA